MRRQVQAEYFGAYARNGESPRELLSIALAGWARHRPGVNPTHVFVHSAAEAPEPLPERFELKVTPLIQPTGLGVGIVEGQAGPQVEPAEPEPAERKAPEWPPRYARPPRTATQEALEATQTAPQAPQAAQGGPQDVSRGKDAPQARTAPQAAPERPQAPQASPAATDDGQLSLF